MYYQRNNVLPLIIQLFRSLYITHCMTRSVCLRNGWLGLMPQSIMDRMGITNHLWKPCPNNPSGLPPNFELTMSFDFKE